MRDWRQAGHGDWRLAVNLSALQLASPSLLDEVATTLSEYALAPGQLTLEITETMAMRDAEACLRTLGQLNALGVRIAIDDFGTGYSNLLYLRKLPAHELKIDRSFVQAMDGSAEDIAIVAAVVALAHTIASGGRRRGNPRPAQHPGTAGLRPAARLSAGPPDGRRTLHRHRGRPA